MIFLIIITVLSIYIWLRYINNITHTAGQSRRLWLSALYLGTIMTSSILYTPQIIIFINRNRILISDYIPFIQTWTTLPLAIGWSVIITIIGILLWIIQLQRSRTHIMTLSFIYIIGIIVFTLPELSRIIPWILTGYVVLAEEYIKSWSAFAWHQHSRHIISDALTYGILSGLWFGIIENIWYIVGQYSILGLWGTAQLIAIRSISSVMMHLVFSWCIMRLYINTYKKIWHIPALISWYISWVCIHLLYNTTIAWWHSWILIAWLFIGYIILSKFLYHSDSLYIKKGLHQS